MRRTHLVWLQLRRWMTTDLVPVESKTPPQCQWFLQRGFAEQDYQQLVSRYPRLQEISLDQSISQKLSFLQEKGMNRQGIVRFFDMLLKNYPEFLQLDLNGEIKPAFSFLTSVGLRGEEILIMVIKFPQLLGYDVKSVFSKKIKFLDELGLTNEDIIRILFQFPQLVEVSLEHNMQPLITYLSQEIDLTKADLQKILKKAPEVLGVRLSAVRSKLDYLIEIGYEMKVIRALLKRYPFFLRTSLEKDLQPIINLLLEYSSREIVHGMFYKCPQVLTMSYEEDIHPKFHFLVELGYDPTDLGTLLERFPELLCYSLEEEIMPAVQRSMEIGLSMLQTRITFARSPELFRQTILKVKKDSMKQEKYKSRSLTRLKNTDNTSLLTT